MSWEAAGGILGGAAALYTIIRVPTIERLKRSLDRELSRFNLTYDRQLEVIVELYEKLASVEQAAHELTKPMRMAGEPSEAEAREHLINEFESLRWFFTRRRLFLPKELASDVSGLIEKIRKTSQDFIWMREEETRGRDAERARGWMELWNDIKGDVPKVREEIEDKFRTLLGIS